jgi:hypothetical protein
LRTTDVMRFRNLPRNRIRRSFISRWNNWDAFSHNPLLTSLRNQDCAPKWRSSVVALKQLSSLKKEISRPSKAQNGILFCSPGVLAPLICWSSASTTGCLGKVRQVDSKTLRAVPSRYIMKIYKIKFHGTASVESDSLQSADHS